jgi:Flp pilus assembly pilin Flp
MLDKLVVKLLTLKAKLSSERGQDLMEYAIITGGIALALVGALAVLTPFVGDWFGSMGDWFAANLIPSS